MVGLCEIARNYWIKRVTLNMPPWSSTMWWCLFWVMITFRNIKVFKQLIAAWLHQLLKKICYDEETEHYVTPGRVKNCIYNSVGINLAPRWEFHPGQDRQGEFTLGGFFFSFLVVSTTRILTTDRVEFTAESKFTSGRKCSCKQVLCVVFYLKQMIKIFVNFSRK